MNFLLSSVFIFYKVFKKKILRVLSISNLKPLNVEASPRKIRHIRKIELGCTAYFNSLFSSYFFYFSGYSNKKTLNKKSYQLFNKNSVLWSFFSKDDSLLTIAGILNVVSFFKYALTALLFVSVLIASLVFLKKALFFKMLSAWLCVFYFSYLLVSGFVFFIKKYQFSKFTGAIQRFWKRTFIIFWSLEVFLFIIFIYLLFNSNYEPFYIYDNAQTQKNTSHVPQVYYYWICILSWFCMSVLLYFILPKGYRILPYFTAVVGYCWCIHVLCLARVLPIFLCHFFL